MGRGAEVGIPPRPAVRMRAVRAVRAQPLESQPLTRRAGSEEGHPGKRGAFHPPLRLGGVAVDPGRLSRHRFRGRVLHPVGIGSSQTRTRPSRSFREPPGSLKQRLVSDRRSAATHRAGRGAALSPRPLTRNGSATRNGPRDRAWRLRQRAEDTVPGESAAPHPTLHAQSTTRPKQQDLASVAHALPECAYSGLAQRPPTRVQLECVRLAVPPLSRRADPHHEHCRPAGSAL